MISRPKSFKRLIPACVASLVFVGLLIAYPPFHVVPLVSLNSNSSGTSSGIAAGAFDARAFAIQFWDSKLLAAVPHATNATDLASALERSPKAAADNYARRVGLGGAVYYFVAGEGRVVRVEKGSIYLALGDATKAVFVIQTGPIFGNALRDGTGLLDMNTFLNSTDFNALAAELDQLVETRVLPRLRENIAVGARLRFAGCAEVSDSESDPRPLQLVPVQIEVL